MVQIVGRLFMHGDESRDEFLQLSNLAEGLMIEIIGPLGEALTTMPAGPSYAGRTAGPGFRLSRGAAMPTQKHSARVLFVERLKELNAYCGFLELGTEPPPVLTRVKDRLAGFAAALSNVS